MGNIIFENAYYIKLGESNGWAEESISEGVVRIGWRIINLDEILKSNWPEIWNEIKQDYINRGKKTGWTNDYNALERFANATVNDVFITFFEQKMYWCQVDDSLIEQDNKSKYRKTQNGWSCVPLNDPHRVFYSNEISGKISKTQAFQGTLCMYKPEEVAIINRLINGIPNENVAHIQEKKKEICELIRTVLTDLHWKDCEILTDLLFQQSGWHRVSMDGGSMEFMDFEYVEPINNDRYMVQVKSGAKKRDFLKYQNEFTNKNYRKLFFVSFNPNDDLRDFKPEQSNIENLCGTKLASLIFDLGLVEWVLKKTF